MAIIDILVRANNNGSREVWARTDLEVICFGMLRGTWDGLQTGTSQTLPAEQIMHSGYHPAMSVLDGSYPAVGEGLLKAIVAGFALAVALPHEPAPIEWLGIEDADDVKWGGLGIEARVARRLRAAGVQDEYLQQVLNPLRHGLPRIHVVNNLAALMGAPQIPPPAVWQAVIQPDPAWLF